MSCSPFDLRDYALDELTEKERCEVELHVRTCDGCREELQRLHLTQSALLALRDEEIPQRIAFVSDKVFEPSPLRRWMQSVWRSGPRLGFASAAMLSAALLLSAWLRPPAIMPLPAAAPVATIDRASLEAEFVRRLREAVEESEARQAKKTAELLAAAERRFDIETAGMRLTMDKTVELMLKRVNVMKLASNRREVEE